MEFSIILTNITYAISGTILVFIAMAIGYKIFDKITPFDTAKELDDSNVAVGIVVGSMFVGLSIAISFVIGMSLN